MIQYACEDTLDPKYEFTAPRASGASRFIGAPRDGMPTDSNDAATDTIPTNRASGIANTEATRRFGMHENPDYYQDCTQRSRNRGLWTADQNINRNDARGTRQNPNGNRNGLECPEERDYYPYWHPSPWIDIAVLHDYGTTTAEQSAWCNYFTTNSQNTASATPGVCIANPSATASATTETADQVQQRKNQGNWWNNRAGCEGRGHTWSIMRLGVNFTTLAANSPLRTLQPPFCGQGSYSRSNHLGNGQGTTSPDPTDLVNIPHDVNANRFIWTIPNHVNENCVLRLRYNMTTKDFPETGTVLNASLPIGSAGVNASLNGRTNSPVIQDPYVYLGNTDVDFVSLALNTNQYGRTFQDRSYVFAIRRPATAIPAGAKLFNLNVRGKRGNIVQVYPSVEYDFVPDNLNLDTNDQIHFQWTGSDYNPRRGCNNGEGGPPDPNTATAANENSRADRSNIVDVDLLGDGYPSTTIFEIPEPKDRAALKTNAALRPSPDATTMVKSLFSNPADLKKMAFIKQSSFLTNPDQGCLTQVELDAINNEQVRENHPRNCAKLNAAFFPYFDGGRLTISKQGTFPYMSTRNNNFSNRDQKGRICVATSAATCNGQASAAGAKSLVVPAVPASVIVSNLITEETFAFNEKDNDANGDGEKYGCGFNFFLANLDEASAVGLFVGMIILGAGVVLVAQFGLRWYLGKPRGECRQPVFPPLHRPRCALVCSTACLLCGRVWSRVHPGFPSRTPLRGTLRVAVQASPTSAVPARLCWPRRAARSCPPAMTTTRSLWPTWTPVLAPSGPPLSLSP